MLSSAALLALCIQVADLSSLYLSFEDRPSALMDQMDEAEIRWIEQLRTEVGTDEALVAAMQDGFVAAMELDGAAFYAQWEACLADLDGTARPGNPPRVKG
ncbi:MAG: hypothetical protein KI785_04070 [Devosiaceae bacterium]|nr:hypothetical protein [Devosiaceae bacterium MH13]